MDMEQGLMFPGVVKTNDVVIVACHKQVEGTPVACSFYNASVGCKRAFKERVSSFEKQSLDRINNIRKYYTDEGRNVVVSHCSCEYKRTEARSEPQLYIESRRVIYSGGNDNEKECDSLRTKQRVCQ